MFSKLTTFICLIYIISINSSFSSDTIAPEMLGQKEIVVDSKRYIIGKKLGQGKSGVVYHIYDENKTENSFALKLMAIPKNMWPEINRNRSLMNGFSDEFMEEEHDAEKSTFKSLRDIGLTKLDVYKLDEKENGKISKLAYLKTFVKGETLTKMLDEGSLDKSKLNKILKYIDKMIEEKLNIADLHSDNWMFDTNGNWELVDGYLRPNKEKFSDQCETITHYYRDFFSLRFLNQCIDQINENKASFDKCPIFVSTISNYFLDLAKKNACNNLANDIVNLEKETERKILENKMVHLKAINNLVKENWCSVSPTKGFKVNAIEP